MPGGIAQQCISAAVYDCTRQANPLGWSGQARDWRFIEVVHLEHDRQQLNGTEPARHAAWVNHKTSRLATGLRAGLALSDLLPAGHSSRTPALTRVVVGYCALGRVMNTITPSVYERGLWVPVLVLMLASSTVVAFR